VGITVSHANPEQESLRLRDSPTQGREFCLKASFRPLSSTSGPMDGMSRILLHPLKLTVQLDLLVLNSIECVGTFEPRHLYKAKVSFDGEAKLSACNGLTHHPPQISSLSLDLCSQRLCSAPSVLQERAPSSAMVAYVRRKKTGKQELDKLKALVHVVVH